MGRSDTERGPGLILAPDAVEHSAEAPGLAGLMGTGDLPVVPVRRPEAAVAIALEPPKPFRRRFWRDLGIGALLVVLTHIFLVQVSVVRGLSMSPSLRDGDRLMVDRISYSLIEVERFDVVVLRYPKNPSVDFVKRVVGLPGDRVELCGGLLQVNGENLPEGFAHIADIHAAGSWVVPEDSYFVLGDNRPISCDSREFGMVKRELLKGKVRAVFWPLDRFAWF